MNLNKPYHYLLKKRRRMTGFRSWPIYIHLVCGQKNFIQLFTQYMEVKKHLKKCQLELYFAHKYTMLAPTYGQKSLAQNLV